MKKHLLWLILLCVFLSGLISKVSIAFNLPLSSDNAQAALYFYDVTLNHNYLFKNWYLTTDSLLFIDFPVYFIFGLIFDMSQFTVRLSAFCTFGASVFLLSVVIFRVFGIREAALSAVVLFTVSLVASSLLLQPFIHVGTIGFSFLALFLVVLIIRGNATKKINVFYFVLLSVLSVLSVFSDPYFIFIFTMPVVSALIVSEILKMRLINRKTGLILLLSLILSAAAGILMQNAVGMFGLYMSRFLLQTRHIQLSELGTRLSLYIQAIADLFDMNLLKKDLVSYDMVFSLVKFSLFLAVGISGVSILKKEESGLKKFIILYFLLLGVLLSLATIARGIFAARYLMPVVYIFAVFLALSIAGNSRKSYKVIITVLFIIAAMHNTYRGFNYKARQPYLGAVKYLESENLSYGYSSYGYSNIITFLSGNKVKVRSVRFDSFKIEPYYWISKSDWYKTTYYDGPTFLLVPKGLKEHGFSYLTPETVRQMFGSPQKILSFEDVLLYVWPYNIIKAGFLSVDISDKTPHMAGSAELTSSGYVMHSTKGQSGLLVYGPYWALNKGKYRVRFVLQATGEPGQEAVRIDVSITDATARKYEPKHIRKSITGTTEAQWKEYFMDFTAEENKNGNLIYEFRVFATGTGDVKVRAITVEEL